MYKALSKVAGLETKKCSGSRANLWTNEVKGVGPRFRARPLAALALFRSVVQEPRGECVNPLVSVLVTDLVKTWMEKFLNLEV